MSCHTAPLGVASMVVDDVCMTVAAAVRRMAARGVGVRLVVRVGGGIAVAKVKSHSSNTARGASAVYLTT